MDVSSTQPIAKSQSGWGWLMAFAIVLIALGAIALNSYAFGAKLYVLASGWLLIVGGVLQICAALFFRGRSTGLNLLFGVLIVAFGAVMIWLPVTVGSVVALILVIGLIADAVLEGLSAIIARPPGWVWAVLIGLFSLALGAFIIFNPPLLLMLLGFMVGINLIMRGVILLLVAIEARKLSL